jgi:membrane fusion protein, multidrug efflux system
MNILKKIAFCAAILSLCTLIGCSKSGDTKSKEEVKDSPRSATDEAQTAGADVASATAGKDATAGLDKRETVFQVPVATERLVRREIKAYLSGRGVLSPLQQVVVKAEISGALTFNRDWREGMAVEAGQPIASIENEDILYARNEARKALEMARERLPSAQEKFRLAERTYESKERLFEEGVIPQVDFDQSAISKMDAELSLKQLQSDIETRRTELEKAEYRQAKATVKAPIPGILVRKEYLEPAQSNTASFPILHLNNKDVSAGQSLFGIIDTTRMRLEVDVSSKQIDRVQAGQPVEVHVYGGEIQSATGTVDKISTALDPQTKAFKVTIMVENPRGQLRSGMFCSVDIVTERRLDSIAINKEIVQTRNNRKVVFVVNGDNEAVQRPVTLGISNRDEVEVLEGLREGDILVVRGYETLKDKTRVKTATDKSEDKEKKEQTPEQSEGESGEDSTEKSDKEVSGRAAGS